MCEFDFFTGLICGISVPAMLLLAAHYVRVVRFHKKDL